MSDAGLRACTEKMRDAGLPDVAIDTFAHYYRQLEAGETGLIPEADIEPATDVVALDELPEAQTPELLDQAVVIKLNGGLGTSMGMTKAKSLIEAKDGHTFLDLIARQVLATRAATGARLPLVLMHSFATREDSLAALAAYPGISADLPQDFLQGKEPKVRADDLTPVAWPVNPALEWCPPGHGDLYTSLQTSGLLERMIDAGYRYAFVSNSDKPRRGARAADPRVDGRRGRAVRDGGHAAHRGRPQGRAHRPPPRRRPAAPARVGADPGRGSRRPSGHPPPSLGQHQQPVAGPARAGRPSCSAATGSWACR